MKHLIRVHTPSHTYPIYIGGQLSEMLHQHLSDHSSTHCVIVSNETVAPLYLEMLQAALMACGSRAESVILPDGESYKNLDMVEQIYDQLLRTHTERKSTLIALGGGVVGDMAGFAAATYQRGMPFIQIPTTLLSQVDSSVGGKTGVNHPLGKNMIGAFYQPQAVFAAQDVLQTLPKREFSAGMAEVIKYAVLGDAAFLVWLERHIDALIAQETDALAYAVKRCCEMKAAIVAADERESGQRALLNLGHTFGHAIETEVGYGIWLHGEAVAAGMVAACRLSECLGYLTAADTERVKNLLLRAYLPVEPPKMSFEHWLNHMQHDKKVEGGKLRFVVLKSIGHASIQVCEDAAVLRTALREWLPE